ncbi:MAG: DUF4276 family protein [Xenococcaceae cyanobacterium]
MSEQCYHFKFILFVTGKGEKQRLSKMFDSLSSSKICTFAVKEFFGQRRPITSQKRLARMAGKGQQIPNRDFEQIGAPARRYIEHDKCNRVILIDDLEKISKDEAIETFHRYRTAFDKALKSKKGRASVHFLVNMLEAYFFAHPDALNIALALKPPVEPHDGDVEAIQNPKSQIKKIFPGYSETKHPELILDLIDLDIVLANPKYCSSLRTCVKWIVNQLKDYPDQEYFDSLNFEERFHLRTGQLYTVTSSQ